ncbi:MAG: very short patch repair endonuclease [Rhodanobacter sp.]|jgi:DNA mismatch endonuclease (patch repair protein)
MTDIVDRATRSRMMSGIRGRDTKPEVIVRKYLHAQGLRYRIAPKNLPGKPDIVLPKYRTVVFVHGCFWHRHRGCKYAATPSSNIEFWSRKFAINVERDKEVRRILRKAGWQVLVVWGCQLESARLLAVRAKITRRNTG